jgi:two-component system cell cycle sensor histidine kinase/response regulator CckA
MSSIGKILVVDDEVELKNILVESLTSRGYKVAGFSSGEEALAALRGKAFDVLLTDLMMPAMDGITLVRESLQIDPHLVCIMMTGQGTIQTAVDAMKEGAFDYVLKPFRLQAVLPVLTRAMNARHMRLENLQLRETVAIYELGQTIAFTLDSQTIISKLADAALQQTDADEVSILLPTSEGSDELYVAAVRGENRERLLGERVPLDESISGWVARAREPLLLEGEVNDNRFRSLWPHPEIRSAISIPMQVANKLVGVININALSRPRPFTLGQMKALTILASTAAAALESASLYSQVRRAENSYRSIFENAVEGIFQSTLEGRFITVNPAMARILGYDSPEEVIEKVTDVAHQLYVNPEDRTEAARLEKETGILKSFEFEAVRKDGRRIWLSLNRHLMRDENGIEIYREGSVEDITEPKRAEEVLRETARSKAESLALLDTTLSSAPIGFAFHNCDLVFERINESLAAINGLPVEDHIGRTLKEILPEMAPMLEPLLQEVLDTGQPVLDIELNGETPADPGHKHYWSVSFYPVRMQGGEILGVGVLVSEVTARKQAEQALRESEERYRDLVENAHDIIFSHDLNGNYTSVNRAGEQITGYTHEECLRLNITDTIAPEHVSKAREMMAKKLAGEKGTAYEVDILAKDGKRVAVEVNTKLTLQDGVPVGVQGIARDMTERKQLEEQLRQSQKMEAIGQLAGGVAHDFNNLLTAINGYSSLALQRLDDSSPVKSYLEEVKKAGDRAANLTRQLLAFGRKQILQPLAINLNGVVSDMNKMLRRLIGEDIVLTARLNSDVGKVMADPGQIEQVLVNLIVNARDAMPRGGNLTIETNNVELDEEYGSKHVGVPAGRYVLLAVSDTGEGMSEAVRQRIFEPFFTTKEKGKGTGLGLSTVYGIVRQSGGNIWVYSEPGEGTTFKVYLPRVESKIYEPGETVLEAGPPGGSETILLVEDEEVVRGLARRILEQVGYAVVEAGKANEALLFCDKHAAEVDLLLTDVVMPEMSGKELADRLKSQCPELKMLFMSGYTDEAIVHHGVLDADVEFIQKPFTPSALARKVREVLDANGNRKHPGRKK